MERRKFDYCSDTDIGSAEIVVAAAAVPALEFRKQFAC